MRQLTYREPSMPLLLGTKGNDIMQWRASAQLAAAVKESLALQWAGSSQRETQSLLERFACQLQDELCQEAQWFRELARLHQALDAALSLDELEPLQASYRETVSAHFGRRQSVLAFCGTCDGWHDRVLAKAVSLAKHSAKQTGQGSGPVCALLVSGPRGRGEQTLRGDNLYLLLHDERHPSPLPFADELTCALQHAGLLQSKQRLWQGSLHGWQALLEADAQTAEHRELPVPLPFEAPRQLRAQRTLERQWSLEAMLDLRFLQGDAPLGLRALELAARAIQLHSGRDGFLRLSRRVMGLPLATGRFGRWRLARAGEHRGELDLEEFALGPLVMMVRILAVHAGIRTGGTVDRIQALLTGGALDVELAARLLQAYQCFMQLKIRHEICGQGSGCFCDPQALDEACQARLKSSVATVLNLQQISYQRIVGQG